LERSLFSTSTNFNAKYITWECTTECNYACSYCWPTCHDGKYRWPDVDKTNKLIEYVKTFSEGKTVILDIMGGEPTLWPDLERFCHSVGNYSLITFSSNGSRTARWWQNFTAPINHLLFSFHPENGSIEHFLEMLQEVHTRYRTTVYILYHPKFKDICLNAFNTLTNSKLKISVKMKRIITEDRFNSIEDVEILSMTYFNCDIKSKYVSMDMFVDNILVNPNELITNDKHSFTGWSCNIGQNYRYIKADGTIYGAACSVATPMGNVYDDGENISPTHTICTTKFCDCKVDLILNTKHVVR
jgi:organic radical activating enzyme